MKYFTCALDKIHIGIMAQKTEKIIQSARTMSTVFETQTIENKEVEFFVSLPLLFMTADTATPHTIVLKSCLMPSRDLNVKLFLLTPRIENEVEIPEDSIQQLPGALLDLHGYSKGIYFNNQTMTFILNIETILEKLP